MDDDELLIVSRREIEYAKLREEMLRSMVLNLGDRLLICAEVLGKLAERKERRRDE